VKGNTHINDYLKLVYNGTAIANLADNAATSPLTTLKMALHTADPGAGGTQTTSAAAYAGYAQVSVNRNSGGFTVSGQTVTLTSQVNFAQAPTNATDVLMFWSVGDGTKIYHSGPIGTNLGVGTVSVAEVATDTITIPGSSLSVGDRITFLAPTGGTIPTGLTSGTVYYVKTVSGADITISTTNGGAAVDITASGQVYTYKVTPITTGTVLVTPGLSSGTTITEQ
jgi:hypothetical protein